MTGARSLVLRSRSSARLFASGTRPGYPLTTVLGGAALLLAVLAAVMLPPNLGSVALAGVATLLLSFERRLGPVPAALLVAIALPFGRAAAGEGTGIADIPIRAQDAIAGVALLVSVPMLLRGRSLVWARVRRGWPILLLLALGALALGIGLLNDLPLRDVIRDARWWFLYVLGVLALATGATRAQLIRGLLIGATLFALLVVAAAILPVFAGGIKQQVLTYDRGSLRMQFINTVFLLPAGAYVAARVARRANVRDLAWLLLLLTALTLSLTRVSLAAMVGVLVLTVIWTRWGRVRRSPGSALLGFGRVVVPFVLAVAIAPVIQVVGTPRPQARPGQPAPANPNPVSGSESLWDRVLFQTERSDLESVATGRFTTYRSAAELIGRAPVLGHGLGVLVDNKAAYNRDRAYTKGKAPGVDNAYLTVGMKSGVVGMAAFGIVMLAPLLAALRGRSRRLHRWFLPAWLGLLALSMTQSYATSSYGPLAVAGLLVLLDLGRTRDGEPSVASRLAAPLRARRQRQQQADAER